MRPRASTPTLGRPNRIDTVELIAIFGDRSEVVYSGAPSTTTAFSVEITVPPDGLVVRARGRRNVEAEAALAERPAFLPPLVVIMNHAALRPLK